MYPLAHNLNLGRFDQSSGMAAVKRPLDRTLRNRKVPIARVLALCERQDNYIELKVVKRGPNGGLSFTAFV